MANVRKIGLVYFFVDKELERVNPIGFCALDSGSDVIKSRLLCRLKATYESVVHVAPKNRRRRRSFGLILLGKGKVGEPVRVMGPLASHMDDNPLLAIELLITFEAVGIAQRFTVIYEQAHLLRNQISAEIGDLLVLEYLHRDDTISSTGIATLEGLFRQPPNCVQVTYMFGMILIALIFFWEKNVSRHLESLLNYQLKGIVPANGRLLKHRAGAIPVLLAEGL